MSEYSHVVACVFNERVALVIRIGQRLLRSGRPTDSQEKIPRRPIKISEKLPKRTGRYEPMHAEAFGRARL